MNLEVLQENANKYKAAKGLVFLGEPTIFTPILVYRRDYKTSFYPGCLDLPGGNTDEFDPDVFLAFQREMHEEFGMLVMRNQIICAQEHVGQPKKSDKNVLPSLLLSASINPEEIEYFERGDEGSDHCAMPLLRFLTHDDVIPAQRERVIDLSCALGILSVL